MAVARIVLAAAIAPLFAQSPTRFDVVSIKLSTPDSVRGWKGGPGTSRPGEYTFGRVTLDDLIWQAYRVDRLRLTGSLPAESQHFDLVAKVPAGTTKDDFRVMMQNLLAERFHLKVHMISKEFTVFDLVVAPGGAKLKESTTEGVPSVRNNLSGSGGYTLFHLTALRSSLSSLASMLTDEEAFPYVVDKTGLTGKYDLTLDYSQVRSAAAPADGAPPPVAPDLATALRKQLGLQLVPRKEPMDVIVVDSVDKLPTEN